MSQEPLSCNWIGSPVSIVVRHCYCWWLSLIYPSWLLLFTMVDIHTAVNASDPRKVGPKQASKWPKQHCKYLQMAQFLPLVSKIQVDHRAHRFSPGICVIFNHIPWSGQAWLMVHGPVVGPRFLLHQSELKIWATHFLGDHSTTTAGHRPGHKLNQLEKRIIVNHQFVIIP